MAYANIGAFRADLAIDLDDASNSIWSTAELDRALEHAMREIALAVGLSATQEMATVAGQSEYDISTYTDILRIDAVEYPADQDPKAWTQFWVYESQLRLLLEEPPSDSSGTIRIYYTKGYTVDANGSNLPEELEELALLGAKGYCLLQEGIGAIGRVNVDAEAAARYHQMGLAALDEFKRRLAQKEAERFEPPQPAWTPGWWGKPSTWDKV